MTYEELVEQIVAVYPEVLTGKMFSMPSLKLGGKAIGGDWGGASVVKLSPEDAVAALKIDDSYNFAPAPNHVMKQVTVRITAIQV